VEVLPNPKESIKWVSELNKTAKEEILILLSSENGLLRTERKGGLDLLNELAAKGIKIKMIVPTKVTNKNNEIDPIKLKYKNNKFRNFQISLKIIIVIKIEEKIKSMIFEIKDDSKN